MGSSRALRRTFRRDAEIAGIKRLPNDGGNGVTVSAQAHCKQTAEFGFGRKQSFVLLPFVNDDLIAFAIHFRNRITHLMD